MRLKLNYIWLDGTSPEPKLRSKIKIENLKFPQILTEYSNWSFDGSSTNQAQGSSSDCYLKPVKLYYQETISELSTIYVLCEVLDKDDKPHSTNDRAILGKEDDNFWVGFEQEYFIRSSKNGLILGFDKGTFVEPQGIYYCGVGGQMVGRNVSNLHLNKCLEYGIDIQGTNAEVAIGQWEYQLFSKGKISAADDLIMSRYFLYEIAEEFGYDIELHPKPIIGEWNGSGLHTNFSNEKWIEGYGGRKPQAASSFIQSND
jgi:glutamine synthetase